MTAAREPVYLVVNADDFAYFPGVSQGIIQAHRNGLVTATGVLANGTSFEEDVPALVAEGGLDAGVHLNLTHGPPLTEGIRRRLPGAGDSFAGKAWFVRSCLSRRIRVPDIAGEWRAQIERCLAHGLTIRFLNSHEHVHILPSLLELIQTLAADYGIPYTRFPDARIAVGGTTGDLIRCAVLHGFAVWNRRRLVVPAPRFLGAEHSGRLTQSRLTDILTTLEPGRVYELMCHPGSGTGTEGAESSVRAYHGWEAELASLTSDETRSLCESNMIRLVGYRDLDGLAVAP